MIPKKQEVAVDPIIEEIHKIREEMAKQIRIDRKAFFEGMRQETIDAGFKFAKLKPLSFPRKKN